MMPTLSRTLLQAALLVAAAGGAAQAATPEEFAALFKQYGFEYRDAERPWGVPITATLSSVTVGQEVIEIDRASALTRSGMQQAIGAFLRQHAANDIKLIGLMSGQQMGKVKVDARQVRVEPLEYSLVKPPFLKFRARIAPFSHQGVSFEAHCDFHFVQLDQHYYQVYFKREDRYRRSEEPQCEVRSSNYRHAN